MKSCSPGQQRLSSRPAASIGPEIEGAEVLREISGDALGILVTNNKLHSRTLSEIVDQVGDSARGVFLRDLTRQRTGSACSPRKQGSISATS